MKHEKIAVEREKTQALEREQIRQHEEHQLRFERGVPVLNPIRTDGFRLSSPVKFVPHFRDDEMHLFLIAFEKCMLVHKFPTHTHAAYWKSSQGVS